MKNPRVALGPNSPRGQASAALKKKREAEQNAPGLSLDMREEPVKKKKGGAIKSSASKRADGCAVRGKTRGKMV